MTPLSCSLHRLLPPRSWCPPRAECIFVAGKARTLTSLLPCERILGDTYKSVRLPRGCSGCKGSQAVGGDHAGLLLLESAEGHFQSSRRCCRTSFTGWTLKQSWREGPCRFGGEETAGAIGHLAWPQFPFLCSAKTSQVISFIPQGPRQAPQPAHLQ